MNLLPGTRSSSRYKWMRATQLSVVLGILYLVADLALNAISFKDGWTILWPLNGVSTALLLMRPRTDWFAMLLGIAVGTGIGECVNGGSTPTAELWIETISALEVLLGAWLLPPFDTLEHWLRRPHLFFRFVSALVISAGVTGVLAMVGYGYTQHQPYLLSFSNWAFSDVLGMGATLPLILAIRSEEMRGLFSQQERFKTVGILSLAYATTILVFSISQYPLLFLLYPALLLVDSLLGFSGAAIAVFGVSLLSVYLTMHHHGPFGAWPQNLAISGNTALQLYLGFHMVALFPVSILFLERRRMAAELRDANSQLTMLASLDGLTGVANRRSLDEKFLQEWRRAMRVRVPLALLMIDIDHFKQYNDDNGHMMGDQCLQAVAQALMDIARRPQDLVARYGGEEFVLLLPQTDLNGARHLAETLRETVFNLAIDHPSSGWGRVTISIGCASCIPARGEDNLLLIGLADTALYQAKQAGRNRVVSSDSPEETMLSSKVSSS